jgi:hypothetical protein
MADKHVDKRSEGQFKYNPQDPYDGGEDPNYAWTSESQDEMSQHYLKEKHKIPHMSENAQSIANSKLSRGGGANA